MRNHETTLKNHGNQPKTIKTIVLRYVTNTGSKLTTMIKKRNVTNTGPQPTSMIKKRDVTNGGAQLTSMIKKRDVTNGGPQPTSMIKKNVTSLTGGPNRPFRCLDFARNYF